MQVNRKGFVFFMLVEVILLHRLHAGSLDSRRVRTEPPIVASAALLMQMGVKHKTRYVKKKFRNVVLSVRRQMKLLPLLC